MQKLDIQLRPSKWFAIYQIVLLLTSLVIVFYLPVLDWLKISLSVAIIMYSLFIFYNQRNLRALTHDQQRWCVQTLGGSFEASLCGDSTVTTFMSILRFKIAGKFFKRSYVVFKDTMLADDYRKLIVHTKWLSK